MYGQGGWTPCGKGKMAKTEIIRLRVSPELKDQLRQAAEKDNRTVSNYIECLIIEALGNKLQGEK